MAEKQQHGIAWCTPELGILNFKGLTHAAWEIEFSKKLQLNFCLPLPMAGASVFISVVFSACFKHMRAT